MKPFVVVCDGFDKDHFNNLRNKPELDVYEKSKVTQEELKILLPKASGLIIRSATTVTKEIVDMAPNLKYVVRAGEGTDNIDKKYCESKGIVVANTPGANANSAAEHAVALMMSVLRKIPYAHASMREGVWDKASYAGNELANKKIGIVGFGKIGQIVAKRVAGFDPKVLFFDSYVDMTTIPYATKASNLQEIFSTCDIVSLHTPLNDSTRNLVNKDLLDLMPSHAILVNASRGGIVNEDDLINHLKEKKIRGAAMDVFSKEPLPGDSPLRNIDNLILTPHLGASTAEAQVRVGEMAANQVFEFFVNEKILNQVKA